jgi:dTDP-4-dehydrorhamnose reductase
VNFIKKVAAWSREKKELRIVDDQAASPTYTSDIASAVLDLAQTDRFGLYHLTNNGSCSRYEWALHILDQLGWKGEVLPVSSEEFPSPAKRPAYSVLDNFGSPETLGYSLPDWKDATMRYLQSEGLV